MPEYFEDDAIESRVIHALRKRVDLPDVPAVEIEVRVEGRAVTLNIQSIFDAAMENVQAQIRNRKA